MDRNKRTETMANPLAEYFYNDAHAVVHKWIHYFDVYHKHFERFIGTDCVILEIGVGEGGSLPMWKHYFGPRAKIFGIDINPECVRYEEENISVFIGSQSDRNFLRDIKTRIPKIDILIDDGGHTMDQQIISFEELFEHISDEGIYLCEDTHTSYWEEYGGGLKRPGTFIEFSKSLIDSLNAWHIRNHELKVSDFTQTAGSVHFYDSIVLVEKQKRVQPRHEKRGGEIDPALAAGTLPLNFFQLKLDILGVRLSDDTAPVHQKNKPEDIEKWLDEKYDGRTWPDTGETMIGYQRLTNLEFCMNETIVKQVKGDVIETGVWRGGACIFMRAMLKAHGITGKKVWVADSFDGLPKPDTILYPEDAGIDLHNYRQLAVSVDEVKNNFRKYGLLDDQVQFLRGWFRDTMPEAPVENLSVLRLDGDLYESTIDVLFYLYPKLSVGGYCIIDDWGAVDACRKATEDYRRIFAIEENIHIIDWTGVFWKKTREIPVISRSRFNAILKRE